MHASSPKSQRSMTTKVYFSLALHADSVVRLLFCNKCLLVLTAGVKGKPCLGHVSFMAERKEVSQNYTMTLEASAQIWPISLPFILLPLAVYCHIFRNLYDKTWLSGVEVHGLVTSSLADKWDQSHCLSQQIHNSQKCTRSLSKQWASPFLGLMRAVGSSWLTGYHVRADF